MDMVEKVARAMWARRCEVLAEEGWPRMSLWEHVSDTLREDFRAEARAAIEAIADEIDALVNAQIEDGDCLIATVAGAVFINGKPCCSNLENARAIVAGGPKPPASGDPAQ